MDMEANKPNNYECNHCNRAFTRKYNLETHIEHFHLSTTFYCDICDQRFGTLSGLQMHLSRGHNKYGQPFPECELCGRIFTRKQNIISHMITVHLHGLGPVIRCDLCEKTFTTDRNLKRHINKLHNPDFQYLTCDDCKKMFRCKQSLIAHIQTVHTASDKYLVKCELCEKVYINNRNLKRHIEMFHGERHMHKCSICPKSYTSNQSLRRHFKTMHNSDQIDLIHCVYCMKTVKDNETLDEHIKLCHGDSSSNISEHACNTCFDYFDDEPSLRSHIKSEHSFQTFYNYCKESLMKKSNVADKQIKSNYACEYCSFKSDNVYELKDHMKTGHDVTYQMSTCNVCFSKFYSRETMLEHKKVCTPPANSHACESCDKIFTDITSLKFHTRVFHPQSQIADPDVTSTNNIENTEYFRCADCNRIYYSERSLKHHVKLKHTTDEAVECGLCGRVCSNKYYLASHLKIVHSDRAWSKCDYCNKDFKSKRNIRRHIEYTHLGIQRYKCLQCETLFKEKRSLRKHVRTKHADSTIFPQCHICNRRFESAKACKTHMKLLHSFNMNTYPCHMCSMSFNEETALSAHLKSKHLAKDAIFKCEVCHIVFNGYEKYERHNETHVNILSNDIQKVLPRCILCTKDFSTRKTLKRHIKKFHVDFDATHLANYGLKHRFFSVECEECIRKFNEDIPNTIINPKDNPDAFVFKCELCHSSYNSLECAIQKYKLTIATSCSSKMILSEFCTAEMSDEQSNVEPFENNVSVKEFTATEDINIKLEPLSP